MRYVRTHLIWMIAICLLSGCHTQTGGLAEGDGDLYLSQDQDYQEISETFVAKLPFIINASETSWIEPYVKSLPESDEKKFLLYQIAVVKGQAGRAQYLRGLLGDADLPESWRPLSQEIELAYAQLLNKPLTFARLSRDQGRSQSEIVSALSFFSYGSLLSSESGDSSGMIKAALWSRDPWQNAGLSFPNGQTVKSSAKQIGLVLPLTGEYAETSQAIKAGFSSAFYKFNKDASLSFYDSAQQTIEDIVKQGNKVGVTHWVGPMDWHHVAELNQHMRSDQTLLALTENAPANVPKLSLSTHVEARMMADHLYALGHRHIAMVKGETEWHQQLADAFVQRWTSLGGVIEQQEALGVHAERSLSGLLKFTTSRKRSMYDIVRPSVRDDISAMFLALNHDEATKVGPMMRYLYAAHIPVYATSAIIAPHTSYADLTDLDGMTFYDWPWMHAQTKEQSLPLDGLRRELEKNHDNFSNYTRFYALGVDAFLLTYFDGIERSPVALHAASGALTKRGAEVKRVLRLARVGKKGVEYI